MNIFSKIPIHPKVTTFTLRYFCITKTFINQQFTWKFNARMTWGLISRCGDLSLACLECSIVYRFVQEFHTKDLKMSLLQVKNCSILTYTKRSWPLSREGSLSCYDLGLHSLMRRTAPFSRLMITTTNQWVLRTCTDGKRETWRETDTIQTGADAESAWLRGAWIMKDVKESTEGLYHGASYGSRNNIAHNEGKVYWLNF